MRKNSAGFCDLINIDEKHDKGIVRVFDSSTTKIPSIHTDFILILSFRYHSFYKHAKLNKIRKIIRVFTLEMNSRENFSNSFLYTSIGLPQGFLGAFCEKIFCIFVKSGTNIFTNMISCS